MQILDLVLDARHQSKKTQDAIIWHAKNADSIFAGFVLVVWCQVQAMEVDVKMKMMLEIKVEQHF